MAFITLEDMTGQMEGLVFPKIYERYQAYLTQDAIVVVRGHLSLREEEAAKLIVDSITPIQTWQPEKKGPARRESGASRESDAQLASKAPKKLFLRLSREDLDRAQALLALNQGNIPVYMHIPQEKVTLLAPRMAWCAGGEEGLRKLRDMLGAENVVLKG